MKRVASIVVCLSLCAVAGEKARKLEWKPHTGDRYTICFSSAICTTAKDNGKSNDVALSLSFDGTFEILKVDDLGDAAGMLHLTKLSADARMNCKHEHVELTEKDLKADTVRAALSHVGGFSVSVEDLNRIAQGLGLEEHFAGLFMRLPEGLVKEHQEFEVDKDLFCFHLRLDDYRCEGEDEIAVLHGCAEAKTGEKQPKARASGQVTCEFNVTQGYMHYLSEDYTTKVSMGDRKLEVHLCRCTHVCKERADERKDR